MYRKSCDSSPVFRASLVCDHLPHVCILVRLQCDIDSDPALVFLVLDFDSACLLVYCFLGYDSCLAFDFEPWISPSAPTTLGFPVSTQACLLTILRTLISVPLPIWFLCMAKERWKTIEFKHSLVFLSLLYIYALYCAMLGEWSWLSSIDP